MNLVGSGRGTLSFTCPWVAQQPAAGRQKGWMVRRCVNFMYCGGRAVYNNYRENELDVKEA